MVVPMDDEPAVVPAPPHRHPTPPSVFQVNVSQGGVPKRPIAEGQVGFRGITVDRQSDQRAHGHPEQALCLYAVELLAAIRAEGHNLAPGYLGENITTIGLEWHVMVPGRRLLIGDDVEIEVTGYASPCWKNARWFSDGDFNRINNGVFPGWSRVYARVLSAGTVATGAPITVIDESAAERAWRQQPYTIRWPQDYVASAKR
jgi:MOSC domain-containing protein YiiM